MDTVKKNKHTTLAENPYQWLQCLLFVACYVLLDYAYFKIPVDVLSNMVYYHGVVNLCADFINFFNPLEQVLAKQNHLLSSKADLEIVRGCDGAGMLFLVMSAILVFQAPVHRKLLGLILGIALVYCLNLVRICLLYFVLSYQPTWFQLIHTYVAPTFMMILGCCYFAWWAFSSNKSTHAAA